MQLKLNKPLVIFDLETTGINVGVDRIVEISLMKVFPDGKIQDKTYRINPEMPIPAAATQVHGITDADVANEPVFSKVANEIAHFIDNSDLGGYNSNKFDVPLLFDEFLRVGVNIDMKGRKLVDVQTIFHKMEQRTLSAAYKFYCQKTLENAHSAKADVKATFEILNAQIERYPELQSDIEFLSDFSAANQNVDLAGRIVFNDNKEEVFNFGKHKGKSVNQVFRDEPSYYDWMMKGDFPLQTKQVITSLRLRDFNKV